VSYADADRGVRVEMASNGVGEVTGWGTDTLTENPFVIVVRGSDHDDVMIGGPDFDQLLGGPGVDRIRGGGSADLLTGGRGAGDVVRGQVGRDILGDAGRKAHLYGGPGADDLWGTKYADHLDGGAGDDEAFPRGGQDTCVSIEDQHGGCESSS
jgi:Ca2+-binding RTX toxin-like protein